MRGTSTEELRALVAGGEQAQVEFKRSTGQRTEGARTACAMLNGEGGFVLFGVRDDGALVGQEVTARTLEDVVHELRRIEPAIPLEPEVVPLAEGRAVIVVRVPARTGGPYTHDGRAYVRQGPTTQVMTGAEQRRRLLEALGPGERWEALPATAVELEHLDAAAVTRVVDEAARRGWIGAVGSRELPVLLDRLGVRRGGRLLNAVAALFLREEHALPYYPQLLLRMARFRGTDKTVIDDSRQEHGHLFVQLDRAQRFLRDHLPIASRILPDRFEREDTPLIPIEALRETLINALCHREYHTPGGSVSVAVFDDRVEIGNTGWLAAGLTPESLRGPHASVPPNAIIAGVLRRGGVIEQWGRGTERVHELVTAAGHPPPEYAEQAGTVTVTFRAAVVRRDFVPPRAPSVPPSLTTLQRAVLRTLVGLAESNLSDLSAALPEPGTSPRAVQHALARLQQLGLVVLQGRGKAGRWRPAPGATSPP